MVDTILHTIGPSGDFLTLAQWAAALPTDLVACDREMIAELTATREDPGSAVIHCRTGGACRLTIRAANGHGFADLTDPASDPLAASGFGAAIRTERGPAITVVGAGTQVAFEGLQIISEDGPAIADDGEGACVALHGCLIDALSAEPAVTLRGPKASALSTALIQRGDGDGICVADGAAVDGCTVFKPPRSLASGIGVSSTGARLTRVSSTVSFGFAQAFGGGISPATALVSDQANALVAPDRLDHPSWSSRALSVDIRDTRPGPFGLGLQRLTATGDADAYLDGPPIGSIAPRQVAGFAVIVTEPTALGSAIAFNSAAGLAELRVCWTNTPPSFALLGRPGGLAAVDGGIADLGGGLYRLWLKVENQSHAELQLTPRLYAARGFDNAGLLVGLYAGAAVAAPGNIGTGFCRADALPGSYGMPAIDPKAALMNTHSVLPDLRPVDGGPLDGAGHLRQRDVLGRGRLTPDTAGAFTLNPAPRFLATAMPRPRRRGHMPAPVAPSLGQSFCPHTP
ncbi:MAG: hypothetical protein AAF409_05285 [Pseudomonadota bacterium]